MSRSQRRKAAKHGAATGMPASDFAAALFKDAVRRTQAGQFSEAMELYRQVLAIEPNHAPSLHHLGTIAYRIDRFDAALELIDRAITVDETNATFHKDAAVTLRALGRHDEALARARRVITLAPRSSISHRLLGDIFLSQQKWSDAVAAYRQALALDPENPDIHNSLGETLTGRGDLRDAAEHFQAAVAHLPDLISAWENLATIYVTCQDPRALDTIVRALQIRETLRLKTLFMHCLRNVQSVNDSTVLRGFVVRSLSEPWGRPYSNHAHIALVRCDPRIAACMDRALQAWPRHLSLQSLFQADELAAVSRDPILRAVLENTIVREIAMERFLTKARAAALDSAVSSAAATVDGDLLAFSCSLARQCFNNEYVFACSDGETEKLKSLRKDMIAALGSGDAVDPLRIVMLGAYEGLCALPGGEALLNRTWPPHVTDVLIQQIREPGEQNALRDRIPQLTRIGDDVSVRVRSQYEENPYPRWTKCAPTDESPSIDARIRKDFPLAPFRPLGRADVDVLIAGCGTGQHVIGSTPLYTAGRMLAVDLSLASLSYAKMRTDALGLTNIDYGQADLLDLGSLDRSFDVIECSGVLHHLADPLQGWRVLLSLLRPHGIMRIGLYSEMARTAVVAARAFIAERGYGSSADDIRRCRQDIIALDAASPVNPVIRAGDFYSTSSCRDLLFHVQEHRFTLPDIKSFLNAHRLQLLGFDTDVGVRSRYTAEYPDDPAAIDLDCWHAYEQRNPHTFAAMYQFFVQRQD